MRSTPFLPEVHANPYPPYHRLRTEDPVHRSESGFWVLTRHADLSLADTPPTWRDMITLRGLASLPLRREPVRARNPGELGGGISSRRAPS